MANVIQIKSGYRAPSGGTLRDAELGFDKSNEDLYVGNGGRVVKVSCKVDTSLNKSGQAADAYSTGYTIRNHTSNRSNPHNVTAQQLGAVTQAEMNNFPKDGTVTMNKLASDVKKAISPLTLMPVGYIYMTTSSTSPASLFGGSWERIENRFLIGASSERGPNITGGEETHKITVAEMPWHSHEVTPHGNAGWKVTADTDLGSPQSTSYAINLSHELLYSRTISRLEATSVGGSEPHNNMPPYYSVYIWRRVK